MNLKKLFQFCGAALIKIFPARAFCLLLLWACLGGVFSSNLHAAETPSLQMLAGAPVNSDGVFLPQIFSSAQPLPAVRLCDAPAFGKNLLLTRAQINELLAAKAPDVETNFSGADVIKISRRSRTLGDSDILGLITSALQRDYIKDRGQLELHLAQPWNPLIVPDEPLTLDVTELPTEGVTPSFIVRFTLRTAQETLGNWQANLKASVWSQVWVASVQLKRGDPLSPDSFIRERRDVLILREPMADFSTDDSTLELAEAVPPGQPLLARMIKPRAVVHRGQHADALVQDGAMSIRTKVDILDDGSPGQTVHARNSITHRELTGTVLNDRTILISL